MSRYDIVRGIKKPVAPVSQEQRLVQKISQRASLRTSQMADICPICNRTPREKSLTVEWCVCKGIMPPKVFKVPVEDLKVYQAIDKAI